MRNEKIANAVALFHNDNVMKGLSEKTQKYYREFLQVFLNWLPNKVTNCKQIDEELIQSYILHLQQKMQNAISINAYARAIRRFCYFCAEKKFCRAFKIKLLKQPLAIKPTLSNEDISRIVENINFSTASTACYFLLSTGIRSNTLCNLRAQDICFDECLVFLNIVKNKRPYTIPITQEFAKHLKNYIAFHGLSASDYVFMNTKKEKYNEHTLYKSLKKYLLKINVQRCGVHIFRHTFAKLITKNGCDAITLMHWLGHSSMEQSKAYVNLYGNELRHSLELHNPLQSFAQLR